MKRKLFLFALLITIICGLKIENCSAQGAALNATGNAADASAILDVNSTNLGMLIPRMTTDQRDAIISPANGLLIYNVDCNNINYNAGTPTAKNWVSINSFNALASLGTITGASSVCSNQTGVTYSIFAVSGATSYNWTLPAGASITASSNPATNITVTFGATAGDICVIALNSCGTSNLSCKTITVNPIPDITSSSATQTICSNAASTITLTSNDTGTTFAWTVTQNGVTGATIGSGSSIAQTLTNSGTTSGTATYTITPTSNSCNGTTSNVVITVNPIPNVTPSSAT